MTKTTFSDTPIGIAERANYRSFIDACRADDGRYRITPLAEPSAYALCFAVFGHWLLNDFEVIAERRDVWSSLLHQGLRAKRDERARVATLAQDKPYLQLLTFTLSALATLGTLHRDPLADHVLPLLPADVGLELNRAGSLHGLARSGNHAMFVGILLLHARDHLQRDTQSQIDDWVRLHLGAMNQLGFWGDARSMSHLRFQNGYHQYELLEYLHVDHVPWERAADAVARLADDEGHFAPYPGGGGCYDYDAVFMLTTTPATTASHSQLLRRTATTLLAEQNPDGGFCESLHVRPRSLANLRRALLHAHATTGEARIERYRFALTLQRPKHDRIHTHWSSYSRRWSESDLWDSWFRMLTLARIECALQPVRAGSWGFINYPGIGYHPSLHTDAAKNLPSARTANLSSTST